MPKERESPEQAARREGGRLLAWFVACAAVVSLLIVLAPISPVTPLSPVEPGDPKSGDHGRRLLEQSAPANPMPAAPLGRHSDGLAPEPVLLSII